MSLKDLIKYNIIFKKNFPNKIEGGGDEVKTSGIKAKKRKMKKGRQKKKKWMKKSPIRIP